MDIAGYNYGVYRYSHDLKKYPDRLILGSETFCNDAYRFWEQAAVAPGGLSYVRLKYTDGAGLTKPLCRGKLKVEVTGGKLLGLGSACPYYELSYLGDVTDTYYGEALAVVQAGDGEQLTVSVSDGTYSAKAYVAIQYI